MAISSRIIHQLRDRVLADRSLADVLQHLAPRSAEEVPLPARLPSHGAGGHEGLAARRALLRDHGVLIDTLVNEREGFSPDLLNGNIENFIGFAQVPVGVIGPLRINGAHIQRDLFVPLATSEGALVASYNRGAGVIAQSGGAAAACLGEAVSRAPAFSFSGLGEAVRFLSWVQEQEEVLQQIVREHSRHASLLEVRSHLTGRDLYLVFDYYCGDASGQNMVTLCTEAICQHLISHAPVTPRAWYIEGNFSGDKKATMLSFLGVRGKKVCAEVMLPHSVVTDSLHTTPQAMHHYWQVSQLGGMQSGSIGAQGHFANALAALFIACGQDAACVSEAAVGVTRMEITDEGDLYVAVTLPNLIVGTVGGGTALPTAQECLAMVGCLGAGHARAFAEVCAATCLAGEISIIAALSAGHFARAHRELGRKRDHGG